MKTTSKLWLAGGLAAALFTVSGCGGNSNNGNGNTQGSAPSDTVPDSAGTTVASFMAYLMGLGPNDERSEPLLVKDSFAAPSDELNESQPLT